MTSSNQHKATHTARENAATLSRRGREREDPMGAAERAGGLVEGMLKAHREFAGRVSAHLSGERPLSAAELVRLADKAEKASVSNAIVKAEASAASRHALAMRRELQLLVNAAGRASGRGNEAEVGLLGLAGTARALAVEMAGETRAEETTTPAPTGREGDPSPERPEEAPTLG